MQEDVELQGDTVVIPAGVKRGVNRRRAGEDMRSGQVALRPGIRLASGRGRRRRLGMRHARGLPTSRGALFSTGDELREPGASLGPSETYDANRPILLGLLQALGCRVTDFGILPDRAEAVAEALSQAAIDAMR